MSMKKPFMFLLFVLSVQIMSAQSIKTSIHEENVRLKDVLTLMEQQTGYSFFYNNADIDDTMTVSLNADNQSVEQILSSLLPGVKCQIEGKKIILSKKPASVALKSTTLKGVVKDASGEPLIGASAMLLHGGKTYGAVADLDGNFILELPFEPQPNISTSSVFKYLVDELELVIDA